jgi:DNA-binding GntR family transcriptional regulator
MSEADLQALTQAVSAMDATVNEPEVWSRQNKQFHLMICQFAGVSLIGRMLEKALDHWDRLRVHYIQAVLQQRIVAAQQEHHALLLAFQARNTEEVERLLRAHNQAALHAYIEVLQSKGLLVTPEGGC